jgi:hypothetical protein
LLKKKKIKLIRFIIISIIIILGVISISVLGVQNHIRGTQESISIPRGENEFFAKLGYITKSLVNFKKIDWKAITNKEFENNNIVRDVTKLYKKEINELLATPFDAGDMPWAQ